MWGSGELLSFCTVNLLQSVICSEGKVCINLTHTFASFEFQCTSTAFRELFAVTQKVCEDGGAWMLP